MKAIKTHLEPIGVRITTGAPYTTPEDGAVVPAGGFFTYISFPPRLPSAEFIAQRAKEEYNLTFAFGQMFVVRGNDTSLERSNGSFGKGGRLCWAWHEEDELIEGVSRLGQLLKTMLTETSS